MSTDTAIVFDVYEQRFPLMTSPDEWSPNVVHVGRVTARSAAEAIERAKVELSVRAPLVARHGDTNASERP